MKCIRVARLVAAATVACAAAQASAADLNNPTGFLYYGYGQGSFGYAGAGYTPSAPGYGVAPGAPGPDAGYAYGYTAPGYGPPAMPAYPAYSYGAYPGYGYGGGYAGGYGGSGCGGRTHRHHGHCCSFGGNCDCCNNTWDGYCGQDCGAGAGCCGAPVKVYHRHRPLGCGAGPCVDAACGASTGRRHCGRARRNAFGCGPVQVNYGAAPANMYGGNAVYDNGNPVFQPNPALPDDGESVEPPSPTFQPDDEPQPMPADDSST